MTINALEQGVQAIKPPATQLPGPHVKRMDKNLIGDEMLKAKDEATPGGNTNYPLKEKVCLLRRLYVGSPGCPPNENGAAGKHPDPPHFLKR